MTHDVDGAGEPKASAVDRGRVQLVQVECPDLDVVEQRQVRREQRPHRPTAHNRNPHVPDRLSLPPGGPGLRERLTTLAARSPRLCWASSASPTALPAPARTA